MQQTTPALEDRTEQATRICTKCAEEKPVDKFFKHWCSLCWNEYQSERRKKRRKNQLRSEFFAICRARNLNECERVCKGIIQKFGGLDRIGAELADYLKNRNKDSPSGFKWMTSMMKLMDSAFFFRLQKTNMN